MKTKQKQRSKISSVDFQNYRMAIEEFNSERERLLVLLETHDYEMKDSGHDRLAHTQTHYPTYRIPSYSQRLYYRSQNTTPKSEDSPPRPDLLQASALLSNEYPLSGRLKVSHLDYKPLKSTQKESKA